MSTMRAWLATCFSCRPAIRPLSSRIVRRLSSVMPLKKSFTLPKSRAWLAIRSRMCWLRRSSTSCASTLCRRRSSDLTDERRVSYCVRSPSSCVARSRFARDSAFSCREVRSSTSVSLARSRSRRRRRSSRLASRSSASRVMCSLPSSSKRDASASDTRPMPWRCSYSRCFTFCSYTLTSTRWLSSIISISRSFDRMESS
mmetsp:Transcript_1545/g.6137  ORF Transcript_1545/g.6137 Transcript_1545/m.6137 type:complete len:200 (+) Transcript_1545:762-1361(+)